MAHYHLLTKEQIREHVKEEWAKTKLLDFLKYVASIKECC